MIAVGGAGPKTNELLSVDVRTGVSTRIAPVTSFTEYTPIGYSPNGRQLALARSSGNAGTASCCHSALIVERADGTAPRRLYNFADNLRDGPADAAWSPDGQELAFVEGDPTPPDPSLGIVDVATGTVRSVDLNGYNPGDAPPVWAPDGSELATGNSSLRRPAFAIATFDLASGALTTIGLGQLPIAWYREGTILAIGERDNTLYTLRAKGGSQRLVFALPRPLQLLTIEPQP